ncbi:MAG: hypothetical protein JW914_07125 [Syntrophaceae bacterium]|nr:hypothetical protein [Syntrophaceae bacterium]
MEKYNNIIDIIKKQEKISPPDDIVQRVMDGTQRAETSFQYRLYRFLFQRRKLSPDVAGILSGKIFSPVQCFFLLIVVGVFYFLMGLLVLWGMKDVLSISSINIWLRAQPYLAVVSGIFIIGLAFLVRQKPTAINFIKYAIITHTVFIVIDALIVQFMLFSPQAIFCALVLTAVAIVLGILLISTIRGFIRGGFLTTENNFANNN